MAAGRPEHAPGPTCRCLQPSAGGILPMTGNGSGAFTVGALVSTGSSPALNAITTADLDGNGHLDVVVTNRTSGTVSLILNPQ